MDINVQNQTRGARIYCLQLRYFEGTLIAINAH